MMGTKHIAATVLALLIGLGAISAKASVTPAALFSDNMVIQQQSDAAIWGWADPGEMVTVTASWGDSANVLAGSDPKSVKYGWADNPDSINLYNKEGLPASPFSTD